MNIVPAIKSAAKATGKFLIKHLPDILIGLGVSVGVGATVVACKETTKIKEALKEPKEKLNEVRETEYETRKERAGALVKAYGGVAKAAVKTYAPAIGMEAASVGLILAGRGVGASRLTKTAAAATAASLSYKNYRDNVIKELGEDADFQFQTGLSADTVAVPDLDKNGKQKLDKDGKPKVRKEQVVHQSGKMGMYSFIFGPATSSEWIDDPTYVLTLLQEKEDILNGKFSRLPYSKGKKVIFLNEALTSLGLPEVDYGQTDGWRLDPDNPDKKISFGIYEAKTPTGEETGNDPGFETTYILTFNCDGPVIGWM